MPPLTLKDDEGGALQDNSFELRMEFMSRGFRDRNANVGGIWRSSVSGFEYK